MDRDVAREPVAFVPVEPTATLNSIAEVVGIPQSAVNLDGVLMGYDRAKAIFLDMSTPRTTSPRTPGKD